MNIKFSTTYLPLRFFRLLLVLVFLNPISLSLNAETVANKQPDNLESDIKSYIEEYFRVINPNLTIKVFIKNSNKIPQNCESPIISNSSGNKKWGNITIKIVCDDIKNYLTVYVEASGEFVVAKDSLPKGHTIVDEDLKLETVNVDKLNFHPEVSIQNLIGSEIMKSINAGEILNPSFVKRPWVIKNGDDVEVHFVGNGFIAKNSGKALNNARLGDKVRVKFSGSQIAVATVIGAGLAEVQ